VLFSASLANSTWKKYNSGWRKFLSFIEKFESTLVWPVQTCTVRNFALWCLTTDRLKPETVKIYIQSVQLAHTLKGVPCSKFMEDNLLKMLLTGACNLDLYKPEPLSSSRRSVNLNLLSVLGHRIAQENWSLESKQIVWAAALVAFFTCSRMGEILPSEQNYDPFATLCWSNVKFTENNEILIFLPSTKTNCSKGEFVDLFPFEIDSCCPVAAIKKLHEIAKNSPNYVIKPVFSFSNGKMFTTKK